jgi:predicted nucleic acid-binding Zn ribbon protein
MPQYKYFCPVKGCKKTKEVWHLMKEVDEPTPDLIKLTTCKKHNVRMERQIFEPQLQGSVGGTFPSEQELLKNISKKNIRV